MPQKTRKDKIRAEIHRQHEPSPVFTYTAKPSSVPTSKSPIGNQIENTAVIRKDLFKTLILALLFIGIECGLSIYSRKLGW